jgi:DNA-binding response OmpR family regulator
MLRIRLRVHRFLWNKGTVVPVCLKSFRFLNCFLAELQLRIDQLFPSSVYAVISSVGSEDMSFYCVLQFQLQDMKIDYDKRRVTMGEKEVSLTQTEYNIVAFLSRYPGKVLTYAAIIKAVWGYPDMSSVKKLQVNMANIRKKLGIRPGENRYIINELGVGYRMQEENEG